MWITTQDITSPALLHPSTSRPSPSSPPTMSEKETNSSTTSRETVTLKANSLYILLYHHPNPQIKYHWALYHHATPCTGGWKFDIINPGGIWRLAVSYTSASSPRTDVLDPDLREPLACAVRVPSSLGEMDRAEVGDVHSVIMEEDGRLNEVDREVLRGGLSCRVYVRRALERLKEKRWVSFGRLEEVEERVLSVGEGTRKSLGKVVVVDLEYEKREDQGES